MESRKSLFNERQGRASSVNVKEEVVQWTSRESLFSERQGRASSANVQEEFVR